MPYKDKRKEKQSKHDRYEELKKDPNFVAARKKYRDANAERNREYQAIYRRENAEQLAELKARRKALWRSSSKEYNQEYSRQRVIRLRQEVLRMYGGKCACCEESHEEFLQVDHVNGDGHSHRKACGAGHAFYRWLFKSGFPKEGFRLLCANCNWARGRYGYCPHEQEKSHPNL